MSFDRSTATERVNILGNIDAMHSSCHVSNFPSRSMPCGEAEVDNSIAEVHSAAVQTSFNGSLGSNSNKRKCVDDIFFDDVVMVSPNKPTHFSGYNPEFQNFSQGKRFINIRRNGFIYHSEEWKPRGSTMYLPLMEDIMINSHGIDQISFESDQFFLADEKGNYVGAKSGHAMHLWRFDSVEKKLYISRTILLLREQDYKELRVQLEYL